MTDDVAFSVTRGHPTEDELAALVVVLTLRTRAAGPPAAPAPSGWSAYGRTVRNPMTPGPDAWRMSGRPQ